MLPLSSLALFKMQESEIEYFDTIYHDEAGDKVAQRFFFIRSVTPLFTLLVGRSECHNFLS